MSIDRWIDKEVAVKTESESNSVVSDSANLWTVACQFLCPWKLPGQNIGMCSCSLLQGIIPTQGSNSGLLHCRQILYYLNHHRSPRILEWVAYFFSSGSSWPRDWSWVVCIAGGFFITWVTKEALYQGSFLTCIQIFQETGIPISLRISHRHDLQFVVIK